MTRVDSGDGATPPISMNAGVKQGDPLIQALEETGSVWKYDDRSVTTLAFAGDLVLLSDSTMGRNLRILESFCLTGLSVQTKKCHRFFADKAVVNDCRPWQTGGSAIHMIEAVRYLWHRI